MTARITYRELRDLMVDWSDDALDSDITIKDLDVDECWAGFVEVGNTHGSLDDDHPVFSFSKEKIIEDI